MLEGWWRVLAALVDLCAEAVADWVRGLEAPVQAALILAPASVVVAILALIGTLLLARATVGVGVRSSRATMRAAAATTRSAQETADADRAERRADSVRDRRVAAYADCISVLTEYRRALEQVRLQPGDGGDSLLRRGSLYLERSTSITTACARVRIVGSPETRDAMAPVDDLALAASARADLEQMYVEKVRALVDAFAADLDR